MTKEKSKEEGINERKHPSNLVCIKELLKVEAIEINFVVNQTTL